MRKILIADFIIFLWCGTISIYGQDHIENGSHHSHSIAIFINSEYIGAVGGENAYLDLLEIDSIIIGKKPLEIDGKSFEYQYYLLSSKQYKFISLQNLLEKYKDKNAPLYSPVFMINEKVLTHDDVLSFKMDEDHILRFKCINSDELGYWKGTEPFTIVSILTETPENIERYGKQTSSNNWFIGLDSDEREKRNNELKEALGKARKED